MTRPLRIEYEGAWYHISCRGNERKVLFVDHKDRKQLLTILAQSLALYWVELHAYVLMSNHFHLVVRTRKANLHKFMQRFNTTYTVYFNRRYKRIGHLYQGRYKGILIDGDHYLLELSRYVHLNPVRLKECSEKSIEEKKRILQHYQWSSYQGYIKFKNRQDFMEYATILGIFGRRDTSKTMGRYRKFVLNGILKEMSSTIWKEVKGQTILGGKEFVEGTYERYLKNRKRDKREQAQLTTLSRRPITIGELVKEVATVYGVPEKELYKRGSSYPEARSMAVELCRIHITGEMSLSAIGEHMGGISAAAIGQNSKRLKEKVQKNKKAQQTFEALQKNISGLYSK